MKIKGIKIYDLSGEAYRKYIKEVKGNKHKSPHQVQLKLSRNIHLAAKIIKLKHFLKGEQVFIYGNLKIIVKGEEIVDIENFTKETVEGWEKDEAEYIRVSRLLGIRDNKFSKKKKNYKK